LLKAIWFILALTAATFPGTSAGAKMVMHRGNGGEPGSLDPHLVESAWEHEILGDLFLGLTTEDAAGQVIPGAAERWSASGDGLVWTFTLRPGLVWSDGVPLTAEDFVYAFRRLQDPKTGSKYASVQFQIKNASAVYTGKMPPAALGVRAPTAQTFEIMLEHPAPYLPHLMMHATAYPLPRHVIAKVGGDWIKPGTIVTNGPYVLETNSPQEFIKLTKNPRFHEAASVAIDEVFFYPIDDEKVALTRYRGREIDANISSRGFPVADYDWLQANLPGEARVHPMLATRYITVNLRKPPFDNHGVRRALSLCIDRKTLALKLGRGLSDPAYAFVPPGIANYSNTARYDFADWPADKRVAEAKRLMAQAGYSPERPLTVTHLHMTGEPRRRAVALTGMLKACGFLVKPIANEPRIHYATVQEGRFDMAEAAWSADYNDPQSFLYLIDSRAGAFNYGAYNNPRFDALLDRAKRETNSMTRGSILTEAEQLALDEQAVIPFSFMRSLALVAPYVKGYVDNPSMAHRTRWMRIEK
jgi:oligopeptide transport system substrate-binding protein